MSASRLIIGTIILIIGIFLIVLAAIVAWWILFYGIPLSLIGLWILFNKNEDKIEKRKDLKEKEYKK